MHFRFEGIVPHSPADSGLGVPQSKDTLRPRILLVDDEHAHLNVLGVMMEDAGITSRAVSSAREALTVLQREPMDAVIADLNMPGVSGMDLLAEVRLRHPHLVFLMATGIEDVRLGVQAMRQGPDDYLTKPLQVNVIMVSLERAFPKKSLEREGEKYRQNLEEMVCTRTVQLQKSLGQVEQSYADALDALGASIDMRE